MKGSKKEAYILVRFKARTVLEIKSVRMVKRLLKNKDIYNLLLYSLIM